MPSLISKIMLKESPNSLSSANTDNLKALSLSGHGKNSKLDSQKCNHGIQMQQDQIKANQHSMNSTRGLMQPIHLLKKKKSCKS